MVDHHFRQLIGAQGEVERLLRDAGLEDVEEDHCLDRHRDAAGGGDQRLRDGRRHHGEAALSRHPDLPERPQDADDRAEQTDEGHRRPERPEDPQGSAERLNHLAAGPVDGVRDPILPVRAVEGGPVERHGGDVRSIGLMERDGGFPAEQGPHDLLVQLARLRREPAQEEGAFDADDHRRYRPGQDDQLGDDHHRAAGLQHLEQCLHGSCLTRGMSDAFRWAW